MPDPAPRVLGLQEAALYVSDLDRAAAFYQRVLGLSLTLSIDAARFLQTGEASTIILFNAQAVRTRVSEIPSHGTVGQGHVALAVAPESMDAWRARLTAEAVEIEHEHDWPLGTHSIYLRDPDGNSIELMDARHYRMLSGQARASATREAQ